MKPLNSRINDTFRYQRHLLTIAEIQEALDDYEALIDAIMECDHLDPDDPAGLKDYFLDLQNFKDENEDTIEEAEAALQFVDDIKRVYEDRFGRILDTPLDTLVQWISDNLQRVPDEE